MDVGVADLDAGREGLADQADCRKCPVEGCGCRVFWFRDDIVMGQG
jgi:hypothetical protein